ncbi:MAG: hypothetical protein ITG00_04520 [Flavobacterium sp.]|nr:hypothetical protein [Flavobacterium sp.]
MILPFSTQMSNKPNHFVEKIWEGFLRNLYEGDDEYQDYLEKHKERFGDYWEFRPDEDTRMTHPKIHTFREDKTNRWQTGTLIHPVINNRSKNYFQFAPTFPCKEVQDIFMTYYHSDIIQISVDNRILVSYTERLELAWNDGFDSWDDFFDYWYPIITANGDKGWSGKIIHFTDLKY